MSRDLNETDCSKDQHVLENLFEQIFKDHHQKIFRLAFSITKSHQQSADIVQEVFLKLWEHRAELENLENVEGWLRSVAKNKIIDFLRKSASDEQKLNLLWKKLQKAAHHSVHILEAKEAEYILYQAINELPQQRRQVFRMNREGGLSYQEIADELSISKHTVKNQLWLALRFLQKKFSLE